MPIVTNHKNPGFREFSRTPAEKKLVDLESKVELLEKKLSQAMELVSNSKSSNSDTEESTK